MSPLGAPASAFGQLLPLGRMGPPRGRVGRWCLSRDSAVRGEVGPAGRCPLADLEPNLVSAACFPSPRALRIVWGPVPSSRNLGIIASPARPGLTREKRLALGGSQRGLGTVIVDRWALFSELPFPAPRLRGQVAGWTTGRVGSVVRPSAHTTALGDAALPRTCRHGSATRGHVRTPTGTRLGWTRSSHAHVSTCRMCLLPEGPSPLTPRTSSSLPFASPAPPRGREGLEGASRGWARPAGPLRLPRTVPHPVCCWCRLVTERGSGHTHTRRRVSLRPPFPGRPSGRSPGGAALGAEVFGARGFSAPRGRLTSGVRRPPPRPRPHSPSSVPPGPAPCSSSRRGSWAPNGALCPPPARTRP